MKSRQPATQARLVLVAQLPALAPAMPSASSGRALQVTSGGQKTGFANRGLHVWTTGENTLSAVLPGRAGLRDFPWVGQFQIGGKENRNLVGQITIGDTGSFLRRR